MRFAEGLSGGLLGCSSGRSGWSGGGDNPGTTAGTYNVTVTDTSGNTTTTSDKVLLVSAFSSKQDEWFDLECVNVFDGKKRKACSNVHISLRQKFVTSARKQIANGKKATKSAFWNLQLPNTGEKVK